jgi:hypothetical protein
MTLSRITRAESWTAAGTSLSREKTAVGRHQAVGAFGRDLVLASEWHCPADAVARRLAKTLGESYGLTTAAALIRAFGHHVIACIGAAEADRSKDAPIAVIDLVREKDGRRAFMACGLRAPVESVEGYIPERVVTTNLSFVIRSTRAAAARAGLVGFDAPFMPAPDSEAFAKIMKVYIDAQMPDIVEEAGMRRAEQLARRIGAQARTIAMNGVVSVGGRRAPQAA